MPKLVHKKVDPDTILDESDIAALKEAEREEAAGELVSHEKLMRELGVRVRRRVR